MAFNIQVIKNHGKGLGIALTHCLSLNQSAVGKASDMRIGILYVVYEIVVDSHYLVYITQMPEFISYLNYFFGKSGFSCLIYHYNTSVKGISILCPIFGGSSLFGGHKPVICYRAGTILEIVVFSSKQLIIRNPCLYKPFHTVYCFTVCFFKLKLKGIAHI